QRLTRDQPPAVGIVINDGDGTFRAPRILPAGQGFNYDNSEDEVLAAALGSGARFAGGDLNGDGIPDVVVTDLDVTSKTESLGVLFGKGDGTFWDPVPYAIDNT